MGRAPMGMGLSVPDSAVGPSARQWLGGLVREPRLSQERPCTMQTLEDGGSGSSTWLFGGSNDVEFRPGLRTLSRSAERHRRRGEESFPVVWDLGPKTETQVYEAGFGLEGWRSSGVQPEVP